MAYNQQQIELHSLIWVRYNGEIDQPLNLIEKIVFEDKTSIEYYENLQIRKDPNNMVIVTYLKTTTGRVIFNFTVQKNLNIL